MVALVTIRARVVDHLVHQDEAGLVLWQESLDHVTLWFNKLAVVLSHGGKTGLATQLPRDLTPRSLAEWSPVIAATAGDGIELGADEDGNCCLRDRGHTWPRRGYCGRPSSYGISGRSLPGGTAA